MRFIIIVFSVMSLCCVSFGKTNLFTSKKFPSYKLSKDFRLASPKLYMTKKRIKKYKKTIAPKEKRWVAAEASVSEDDMSPELKALVDRVLKIEDADELEGLLYEINRKYDEYKHDDIKFFVAQLVPLKDFRGWLFKLRPLFEKSKSTHSMSLAMVRQMVAAVDIFSPQTHWQAGLDYLMKPNLKDLSVFNNERDLQVFGRLVIDSLETAKERIENLDFTGENKVVIDNRIFFNSRDFGDDLDRFRLVGEAERLAALSSINAALYSNAMFQAYSVEGLLKVSDELGKLIGLDKITALGEVEGVSAEDRVGVIGKNKYNGFLTRRPDGAKWTRQFAYVYLQDSVRTAYQAWQINKDAAANAWQVLDPQLIRPFNRINRESFATMERLLAGKTTVASGVNEGETIDVNLKRFFTKPPQDLKAFMPTGFDHRQDREISLNKSVKYRNYRYGAATKWKTQAFSPYFPGITNDQIPDAMRVLTQSWGGAFAAAPLGLVF